MEDEEEKNCKSNDVREDGIYICILLCNGWWFALWL